jgi:acyl-CoA synthetase (AMP-forming)/AMP-acid ligase II
MARQGHGFITGLPIRVIKPDEPEGVLIDVKRDGKEIGEIVFFGNICAKEYLKDAEASRKLFAGGALHSGDLAVWHEDGSAQILDRAKDIIISGKSEPFFSNRLNRDTDYVNRRREHILSSP